MNGEQSLYPGTVCCIRITEAGVDDVARVELAGERDRLTLTRTAAGLRNRNPCTQALDDTTSLVVLAADHLFAAKQLRYGVD